jgi:hypothetical protein
MRLIISKVQMPGKKSGKKEHNICISETNYFTFAPALGSLYDAGQRKKKKM